MLRGFRWQFAAMLVTAAIFSITLTTRNPAPPAPTVTPSVTASASPEPTATPMPTTAPLAAVTSEATRTDDVPTFTEAVVGDVRRLNPLLAVADTAEADITSLIFEGLTRTNQYGEPVPALAANWVTSSDSLEYVVTLRDDVLWQDGTPFTARDVAFTMELLRSTDFPGPSDLGNFWRTVETQVLSDTLIRFRLTQPFGGFLNALSIGILPEHALRGTQAADLPAHPFNLTPMGTGPYQLEAIRTADNTRITAVELRVAPVYRQRTDQPFAVERLRFQLFDTFEGARAAVNAGAADGLASRSRRERFALLNTTGTQEYTTLSPKLGVLLFNWAVPAEGEFNPFREQRVRIALETGIERSSVIQRNLPNLAVEADSPLFPGSWAYASSLPWPEHNPAQAQFLLESASIPAPQQEAADPEDADPNVTPAPTEVPILLTFSIMTPEDAALIQVAQEIADQWSLFNLDVTVDAVDAVTYRQRLENADFDTAIVELNLGSSADPDVYGFWHQGQFPDGNNFAQVDDRRISETLERARRDANGINRAEHYDEFQREFVERAVALPLFYPLFTYVVSDRVEGVQLGFMGTPADRFRNIGAWRISL